MSIASRQVNVGPSRTLIADLSSTSGGAQVILLNSDAALAVWIGGGDVAAGNGFALRAGASLSLTLTNPDAVYGVMSGTTNTVVVQVFRAGS